MLCPAPSALAKVSSVLLAAIHKREELRAFIGAAKQQVHADLLQSKLLVYFPP
jgi:hypothetical protein